MVLLRPTPARHRDCSASCISHWRFISGVGESPSEPSQALEEMKRLSREGRGKEGGVGWSTACSESSCDFNVDGSSCRCCSPWRQVTGSFRAETSLSVSLLLTWNLGTPSIKWAICGLKEWENQVPRSLKLPPRVLYTPTSKSEAQYDNGLGGPWEGILFL